ncbi:MAG: type II secretion system secretin GspD [Gammaproteobacteria bacterium]|nr:type II secretion system secretin GspD [Gammaproteobacteria bacterium]
MRKAFYALFALSTIVTLALTTSSLAEDSPTKTVVTTKTINQTTTDKPSSGRLWNLQDADILSIINEVSLETGKNFIVDPRVSGKISLISSKPLKPNEVYQVFLSVLGLLGYSAIPSGNVVKIVPNVESTEMATHVATNQSPGRGDEIVVRVIPLENVSAAQLLPIVRPMLPQWSNISAYTPGNVLILIGHASNLQRILSVIQNIDSAANNNIEVIPLHHASAGQVASVLSNLQNSARANGDSAPVSVAADERSNSILLSGNKAARIRMKVLISQLDAPSTGSQGNTDVVYLRYLQAKNLAPILGKIAQNILRTGATDASASPVNFTNAGGANNSKAATPENLTNIQAETNTNALIITAPPTVMRALKAIISKLDIRPAQVLVQAIIVEIDQNDLNNLGIQWGSRGLNLNENLQGGASTSVTFPPLGEGTVGIIPHTQIKAVLSILENKTGVNILSTPSVVVLDNKKATLKVGQEVPQQTGTYATTGTTGTVTPFNTIANTPVVLQLDVIPQINLGSSVRLQLNLKNDTLQNPENPGLNPIINTAQITNSVIVNSDDILVIGGLISNNITESTDKIPILGDIPGVGILFQHKRRSLEKKNLVAFIKPVIIYNSEQATSITNTKYNDVRQAQINWPIDLSSEGQQKLQNILPMWKNNINLPKPFES